jgi:hypothetical protein
MKKLVAFGGWLIPVIIAIVALLPPMKDLLKKKSLSYSVIESSKLIQNKGNFEEQTKIIIGENTFTNPYLSQLGIENTGGLPIKKDDFEMPITIKATSINKFIAKKITSTNSYLFNVAEKSPSNLDVQISKKNNTLTIEPLLLNSGDKIIIQFVSDEKLSFNVTSRIAGIKEITKKIVKAKAFPFVQIINSISFTILFYLMFLWSLSSSIKNVKVYENLLYILVEIVLISLSVLMFLDKQIITNFHWTFPILLIPGIIIWSIYLFKQVRPKTNKEKQIIDKV